MRLCGRGRFLRAHVWQECACVMVLARWSAVNHNRQSSKSAVSYIPAGINCGHKCSSVMSGCSTAVMTGLACSPSRPQVSTYQHDPSSSFHAHKQRLLLLPHCNVLHGGQVFQRRHPGFVCFLLCRSVQALSAAATIISGAGQTTTVGVLAGATAAVLRWAVDVELMRSRCLGLVTHCSSQPDAAATINQTEDGLSV